MNARLATSPLLIASQMWLCTREDFHGRSGCGDTLTGIALAAALLGEQLLLQTMSIEGSRLVVFDERLPPYGDDVAHGVLTRVVSERLTLPHQIQPQPRHLRQPGEQGRDGRRGLDAQITAGRADAVVNHTYESIRDSRDVTRVQDWLDVLSDDAHALVAGRLVEQGALRPVSRGWLRPQKDYEVVRVDDVASASATLCGHLNNRHVQVPRRDALLLGLIKAAKLERHVLPGYFPNSADYVRSLVGRLGSWERALIAATEVVATNRTQI